MEHSSAPAADLDLEPAGDGARGPRPRSSANSRPVVHVGARAAILLLTSLGMLRGLPCAAQAPAVPAEPSNQGRTLVFGAESSLVLLDVVVRDKKGRLVQDLTPADLEVFEDGQPQAVTDFRHAARDIPGPTPARPVSEASASPATLGAGTRSPAEVIAFVFDRLSAEARDSAHRAASAYLEKGHVAGDLMAVFSIDGALSTLQRFTPDVALIDAAFTRASGQAQTGANPASPEVRAPLQPASMGVGVAAATGAGAASAAAALSPGVGSQGLELVAMEARIADSFDRLERNQQGFASMNALMAVVSGLKTLPGRKTIVFFSEGLNLPAAVLPQLQSVIAAANRANVAIYAIDSGGLRTRSSTEQARRELEATAQRRRTELWVGYIAAPGSLNQEVENAEDMLRASPRSGLGRLAADTGGFLVTDTNDAAEAFRRIQEEMRSYYLLSYVPTSSTQDGTFRRITVKCRRGGTTVHARNGYFAVPADAIVPLGAFEARAVAQLGRSPRPDDFPLRAAALSFPEPKRDGRVSVLVELPASALAFVRDRKPKAYQADFTVVARLRNERGVEVDRLSRRYPLNVPEGSIENARRGNVLFFDETDLPPGLYTIEAAAYDALAEKASVRSSSFEVPPAEGHLRLSSLVLVGRVERLEPEERGHDNPLYFGETVVYPNMGLAYPKSAVPTLGFYFVVWETRSGRVPKEATVRLLAGDRIVATIPIALPAPDDRGRVQDAASLPLQQLPPGDYTLQVTVTDGDIAHTRQARFVVTE